MPKLIIDEFTDRTDLSPSQKWAKRNPEKHEANNKSEHRVTYKKNYRVKNREELNGYRREWIEQRPGKEKDYYLKSLYGISLEEYNKILENQGGVCAICEKLNDKMHVDHCHETGAVRGILCMPCNTSLGIFGDNVIGIKKVLEYLEKSN